MKPNKIKTVDDIEIVGSDKEISHAIDKNGKVLQRVYNSKFTQERADILVELAAEGETYPAMCKAVGIVPFTLARWLNPASGYFKKGFYELFIPAYKFGADILEGKSHEAALDSSEDLYEDTDKDGNVTMRPNMASVQRSRLKTDSYLRLAGHRNSLKYGRVERALQAGLGDITVQIVNYSDNKELPAPGAVKTEVKVIENNK